LRITGMVTNQYPPGRNVMNTSIRPDHTILGFIGNAFHNGIHQSRL